MRFFSVIATFALVILASSSGAQIDPDPDGIGIYFDEAATQIATTAEYDEVVTAYLIITHPSLAGSLFMWHAAVHSPDACIWGEPIAGSNIDMNMPPCGPTFGFIVYCHQPLPVLEDVMVIATVTILMTNENQVVPLQVIGNTYDHPRYWVGGIGGDYRDLYPISGSVDLPVAMINGDPPVASDEVTWGTIKSMFQ